MKISRVVEKYVRLVVVGMVVGIGSEPPPPDL